MITKSANVSIGMSNRLKEANYNDLASKFIENNFDKLAYDVLKMGVDPNKNYDMVTDVYISVINKENNGEPFNNLSEYSVENYIYGMLKGYSKNVKYRKNGIHDKGIKEIPASGADEDDYSLNNVYQVAYNSATSYNDIEYLDNIYSINSYIETVLEYENDLEGISLRVLIKNLKEISRMNVDKKIFGKLKGLLEENIELYDSFISLVEISEREPEIFAEAVSVI